MLGRCFGVSDFICVDLTARRKAEIGAAIINESLFFHMGKLTRERGSVSTEIVRHARAVEGEGEFTRTARVPHAL